jgi:hypothetical protein
MPVDLGDPLSEDKEQDKKKGNDAGKCEDRDERLEAVILADPVFDAADLQVMGV